MPIDSSRGGRDGRRHHRPGECARAAGGGVVRPWRLRPLVWPVAPREAQRPAGVAWVGSPAMTHLLDANEGDRDTAITGEDAQSMQRLITAILEKGGQ